MRREKRILQEKLAIQKQLLAEMDAEAYFTRGGRTTLREMMEQAKKREYVPRGNDPIFTSIWDEAHRCYARDVERGGNEYTREAERLATLSVDWLCSGKQAEGRMITDCQNMLLRYSLDWNENPELARLECTVLYYGFWMRIIPDMKHLCKFNSRYTKMFVKDKPESEKTKGYNPKILAERERRDKAWLTSPRPRIN